MGGRERGVKGGGDIQNQGRAGQCSVKGSGVAAGSGPNAARLGPNAAGLGPNATWYLVCKDNHMRPNR